MTRCAVCGEKFTSYGGDTCDFCRALIREEQFNAETGGVCPQCGGKVQSKNRKFCSEKCSRAYHSGVGSRPAAYCVICGTLLPGAKKKYCSDNCRRQGERLHGGKKCSVTQSGFKEYEKASIEAAARGEYLSYGKYMARRQTEREKKSIGAK